MWYKYFAFILFILIISSTVLFFGYKFWIHKKVGSIGQFSQEMLSNNFNQENETEKVNSSELSNLNFYKTIASNAVNKNPKDAMGLSLLAKVTFDSAVASSSTSTLEEKNAQISQSIKYLQQAIALDHTKVVPLYQMGIELFSLGQKESGKQFIIAADKLLDSDKSLNPSAKILLKAQFESVLNN